jgi:hypothetical protein
MVNPTRLANACCDKAPAKALVDVVESAFSVGFRRGIGLAESKTRCLTIPLCFCEVGSHFGFAAFDMDFLVVILWAPFLG